MAVELAQTEDCGNFITTKSCFCNTYLGNRQPFEHSVPFFDRVKIETSPRAKRLPYLDKKKVLIAVEALLSSESFSTDQKKGFHVGRYPIY